MLKVETISYDDLSEYEKDNVRNGFGEEDATYLRVTYGSKTLRLESDGMEPEDATFFRDLSWIKDAIEEAYRLGQREI